MSCACASEPRHKIKLLSVIQHDEETFSFDFDHNEITNWTEGDSSKVFLDIEGHTVGKKFSYATLPDESVIRFTTRIKAEKSPYKARLASLNKGDTIEVSPPKGEFNLRRENRPIIMLSNGVGIAAVRSLIKAYELNQEGIPMLIQVNVDAKSALYKQEFDQLLRRLPEFNSIYVEGRKVFYPLLQEMIGAVSKQPEERPFFYVVGGVDFVNDCISRLIKAGFGEADIITDGHAIDGSSSGCGCSSGGTCGCPSKNPIQFSGLS